MSEKKTCRYCKRIVQGNHACPVKGEMINYSDTDNFYTTAADIAIMADDSPGSSCGDSGSSSDSGGCGGGD